MTWTHVELRVRSLEVQSARDKNYRKILVRSSDSGVYGAYSLRRLQKMPTFQNLENPTTTPKGSLLENNLQCSGLWGTACTGRKLQVACQCRTRVFDGSGLDLLSLGQDFLVMV